jgi:hypothetical protein
LNRLWDVITQELSIAMAQTGLTALDRQALGGLTGTEP